MVNDLWMKCAVFDAKSYEREAFAAAVEGQSVELEYFDFRLSAATAAVAEGAQAVCAFVNDAVDRACLEVLAEKGVKHVALRCAGFNQIDLEAARSLGIRVTRVPAYSPYAVAEHTVALLQTLNRKIHRAYNRVRELNFSLSGLVGFDLHGKTVSIVGTGKIGRITAQIFRGFGCDVLAYDLFPQREWAERHGVIYARLEELLEKGDVISLHVPLTPETLHLLDGRAFARMKTGAYVVNTSRGKLIDSKALITALKEKRLGGVALDVYEMEEGIFFEDHSEGGLDDDVLTRLLTFPNVLITSHQAFLTREALREIAQVTIGNVARLARGEAPVEDTEL